MRRWGRWGAEQTGSGALQLIGAGLAIVALGIAGTLWEAPLAPGASPRPVLRGESTGCRLPSTTSTNAVESALAGRQGEGLAVVRRLCRDEYAGRKAGTPGADRAAAWLAAEFRRIGLEPAPGAPGFLQRFTMPVSLLASRWDRKAKLTARTLTAGAASQSAGQRSDLTRTAL